MELKKTFLRNTPLIWIAIMTIFGIVSELILWPNHAYHFDAIVWGWFYRCGLLPVAFVWLVFNFRGLWRRYLSGKKIWTKTLFIFLIIFVLLNSLLNFVGGKYIWDSALYQSLSAQEIQQKTRTFKRNYPNVIKGNWEPNPNFMEKLLVKDSERIKRMGVNTVSIAAEYNFRDDGSYFIRDEDQIMSNMVRAKENGFVVWVAVSFVGAGIGVDPKKDGVTQERFLEISEELALKWAKIAEDYNVEFFGPQNEMDFIIRKYTNDCREVAQIVSDWYKQVLPKIKQVFTGKVLAKIAWVDEGWMQEKINLLGYDYVGIGLFHRLKSLENFRVYTKEQYSIISGLAKRSNSKWLILEAWLPGGFPFFINARFQPTYTLQDDYYRISIEEYLKFKENKPVGYVFHSWHMPAGSRVKGRPAEKVLKEFYSKI